MTKKGQYTQEQSLWRQAKAYELRQSGLTYKEIGEYLGIGKARAAQLVAIFDRKIRTPNGYWRKTYPQYFEKKVDNAG